MFSEIIPNLIDYTNHLDSAISEIQQQILQIEQITNKLNPNKKPQELKFLQPKTLSNNSPPKLGDLTTDIDRMITAADQFLQDTNKTEQKQKELKNIYDDYEPPKKVKATLEPYKKPPPNKKPSPTKKPPKYYYQRRGSSILKQELAPKITDAPAPKPVKRDQTKSFLKDNSKIIKQSPPKNNNSAQISPQSILIQDQTSPKRQIPPLVKKQPSQPYLQPLIQPQQVQQSNTIREQTQTEKVQTAILRKVEFSGLKELGRLKKMKDGALEEYLNSYKYFREKESKARCRFLTKYHQHMNEKKNIISQDIYKDFPTFFTLKDQLEERNLNYINQQLTVIQPKQLLIIKYSEIIESYMKSTGFDDTLIKILKRVNEKTISKLQFDDLLEIFKVWSKVQIIRQNYQGFLQFVGHPDNQEDIQQIVKWFQISLKQKQESIEQMNFRTISHKLLGQDDYTQHQDDALSTNKLIVKEEIYRFLYKLISQIALNKNQFEQSLGLFKLVLNLLTKGTAVVYIFRKTDLIFF